MKKELLIKTCLNCSEEFKTTNNVKIYCTKECQLETLYYQKGLARQPRTEKYVHLNIKETLPLPGDAVYICNSFDKEIPINALGIITGVVGELQNEYEVVFSPYLPVWIHPDKTIQCASGIKRTIKIEDLHLKSDIKMLFEFTSTKRVDDLVLVKRFITTI